MLKRTSEKKNSLIKRKFSFDAFVFFILAVLFGTYTYFSMRCPIMAVDFGWIAEPAYNYLNHDIFSTISRTGYMQLEVATYWWPPVFFILEILAYTILGFGLFQNLFLLTTILGLTLVLTFILARNLFDKKIALLTLVVLFSNTMFFIMAWVENRPDVLVALFDVIAFMLFYTHTKKITPHHIFLSGLFVGLAGMSHLVGFLMGPSIVVCLLIYYLDKQAHNKTRFLLKDVFFFASGIIIPILLWLLYALQNTTAFIQQFLTRSTVLTTQALLLELGRYKLFFGSKTMIIIGPLLIASLAYGLIKRKEKPICYLTYIILTHIVLFVLIPSKTSQHMASITPFWSMLIASMIYNGIKSKTNYIQKGTFILLAVVMLSGLATHAMWILLQTHTNNYYSLKTHIQENIKYGTNEKIIATSPFFFAFKENLYDIEAIRGRALKNETFDIVLNEIHPKYILVDSFVLGNMQSDRDIYEKLAITLKENASLIGEFCFLKDKYVNDTKNYASVHYNKGMTSGIIEIIKNPDICLEPVKIYSLK